MEEAKKFIDEQVDLVRDFYKEFTPLIPLDSNRIFSNFSMNESHLTLYALHKAAKIKYIDPFKYVLGLFANDHLLEEAWKIWSCKIVETVIINNDINIFKYIFENYNILITSEYFILSHAEKNRFISCMMINSIRYDRLDIIKYIVSIGYNFNERLINFVKKFCPIELAFIKERHDIVKYLASLGALDEVDTSMKEVIKNKLMLDSIINQKERGLNTNLNYLNELVGEFLKT